VSDLYPTKTRLGLLRDAAAGRVRSEHGNIIATDSDGGRRTVSAAVEELCVAGWLKPGEVRAARRQYDITDAGRALLDGAS
jgi:hypothetical protein